jgi:hypothetical protein
MELPSSLTEWVDVIATGGGVIGALVLFAFNNCTARQELRRKRAASGLKLISDMCDDRDVQNAFAILDMEEGEEVALRVRKQETVSVTWVAAMAALNGEARVSNKVRDTVREAFDDLFYFFALFKHCVDAGLIRTEDVAYPACYYIDIINKYDKETFDHYLSQYGFTETSGFMALLMKTRIPRRAGRRS